MTQDIPTDIFDCIYHVLVTEWDRNISSWTLSYTQDPGCKHEHHSILLGSTTLNVIILKQLCNVGTNKITSKE